MSRKITIAAIEAFLTRRQFKRGNTRVICAGTEPTVLALHGNWIAKLADGFIYINPCGHATATTKERLNGLPGVSIKQRNYQWYLNGSSEPMKLNGWTRIE